MKINNDKKTPYRFTQTSLSHFAIHLTSKLRPNEWKNKKHIYHFWENIDQKVSKPQREINHTRIVINKCHFWENFDCSEDSHYPRSQCTRAHTADTTRVHKARAFTLPTRAVLPSEGLPRLRFLCGNFKGMAIIFLFISVSVLRTHYPID